MKTRFGVLLVSLICCLPAGSPAAQPLDPAAYLKGFSDFSKIDAKKFTEGEILAERGATNATTHGISAQFCFFVPTSPEETAKRLQSWDALATSDNSGIYAQHPLKPPISPALFSSLDLSPRQKPVKWLLDKSLATTPTRSELNLSHSEAAGLSACIQKDPSPRSVSSCWGSILNHRATQFLSKGFSSLAPYEMTEAAPVSAVEQLRAMMLDHPQIMTHLKPVLTASGLFANGHISGQLTPSYYWTLYDANHRATLNLGAFYRVDQNGSHQLMDVEYYVSSGYYAAITLFEVIPYNDDVHNGSLVWRGDFFAAPLLRYTKGIERIAYGALMMHEIKKEIANFQKLCTRP